MNGRQPQFEDFIGEVLDNAAKRREEELNGHQRHLGEFVTLHIRTRRIQIAALADALPRGGDVLEAESPVSSAGHEVRDHVAPEVFEAIDREGIDEHATRAGQMPLAHTCTDPTVWLTEGETVDVQGAEFGEEDARRVLRDVADPEAFLRTLLRVHVADGGMVHLAGDEVGVADADEVEDDNFATWDRDTDVRQLSGVNDTRAMHLREAGFSTIGDVLDAEVDTLAAVLAIGRPLASRISADAASMVGEADE